MVIDRGLATVVSSVERKKRRALVTMRIYIMLDERWSEVDMMDCQSI